jgi:hypothetical protein
MGRGVAPVGCLCHDRVKHAVQQIKTIDWRRRLVVGALARETLCEAANPTLPLFMMLWRLQGPKAKHRG